ncbi:hypothetical protein PGT21_016910 [Puccinia graminis f. sp. tritici]|uniref:Uncharacterized protein n=1 Tax=Puccinia graminis f. sp. tritici TaxID=56615 RepID=A0A5B0N4H7_PUCGR|nr:hypothetical protein PGT21_016910 [Puccinia graminis f. sp. tritici]
MINSTTRSAKNYSIIYGDRQAADYDLTGICFSAESSQFLIEHRAVYTKKQIGDTVSALLTACKSGYVSIKDNQDVEVWVTPRQEPRESQIPYDPDFELGKPFCFHGTKAVKQDCLEDEKPSKLTSFKIQIMQYNCLHNRWNKRSCKKQDSLDVVNTMMNTCDSPVGYCEYQRGLRDPNGHVTITSRSTTTSHSS